MLTLVVVLDQSLSSQEKLLQGKRENDKYWSQIQHKGRKIKKGKRNGVAGRALPSNCRDGGGGGRGKEKFNNYFIIQFLNNLLKMTL